MPAKYLQQVEPEVANEITAILMLEERDFLHKWEKKKIVVVPKNKSTAQLVSETIVTLRWFLVNKLIEETKKEITADVTVDNTEILSTVRDYLGLTQVFSKNLGRVLARF